MVNTNNTALGSNNQVELKKAMYDSYMREIIEHGGAPSMDEIKQKVDSLGVYAVYEESLLVNATNSLTKLVYDKFGQAQTPGDFKIDPRREAILAVQVATQKGQLDEIHASLRNLISILPTKGISGQEL